MLKTLLNKLLFNYPTIIDLDKKNRALIESIGDLDKRLVNMYRRIDEEVALGESGSELGLMSKDLVDQLNLRRAMVSDLAAISNQLDVAKGKTASPLFDVCEPYREVPGVLPFRRLLADSVEDKARVWFPTTPSRFLRLDEDPVSKSVDEIRYSRGNPPALDIRESRVPIQFSRRRPENDFQNAEDWKTLFTKTFKKEVGTLDKKFQGRVMEAVLEIAEEPTKLIGDTKKPLVGDLAGQWRYRIGDYRIVYRPEASGFLIIFLRCSSRGDIYH
jgi:mRNA interferase RelE/StbE